MFQGFCIAKTQLLAKFENMLSRAFLLLVLFCSVMRLNAQDHKRVLPQSTDPVSASAKLFLAVGPGTLFPPDKQGKHWVAVQWKDTACAWKNTGTNYLNIQFLKIDYQEVVKLISHSCVAHMDVFGRLNSVRHCNDTARVHSKVNEVHDGLNNGLPRAYFGKDVVVGIVDIGFQTDHPTFYNEDGTIYRVKRFWHQGLSGGAAPAGFAYGSEFVSPTAIQSVRDDDGTHGTHVAGIAAGSGFTTPQQLFRGMAPKSDLVFVTIKYSNDTLGGSALGDYLIANPTIIDAYRYVFDYATKQQKPAVTNLSWGMHTGPHDGTSVFDKAVESIAGPGHIVVGANGNDAGNQMHVSAELNNDTAYTFVIDRNRNDYRQESVYCDFWGAPNQQLGINVSLFDTLGNLLLEEPFVYASSGGVVQRKSIIGSDTLTYVFSCQKSYVNNAKPNILTMITSSNASKCRIRVGMTGIGAVHGWNSGQVYRWTSGSFLNKVRGNDYSSKYLAGGASGSMGENGGTGKSTISVGSYVNRNNWIDANKTYRAQNWLTVGEVSGFSSRGPTTDGRMKPDIAAPGQMVASAVNNRQFAGWMQDYTLYQSQFKGETQYWTMFSGTSMAAPHAAGIIALMLEANPKLTPELVRQVLKATAIKDGLTGTDSNNNYGYGRINALGAVQMALDLNKAGLTNPQGLTVLLYPNPASTNLSIQIEAAKGKAATIQLFDMAGRYIQASKLVLDASGTALIPIAGLSSGSYCFQILVENQAAKGKFFINRE
jgi:subtilisin family serine protease